MLAHVTLMALFFCNKSKLIIHELGPISKANFYNKAEVMRTADEALRFGGVLCPLCGGQMTVHGAYARQIIDGGGECHKGWVAQVHCAVCQTYPALMPDFIMPYIRYNAEVVEAAISEDEEEAGLGSSECPADESTVRRWINRFKERGKAAVANLLSLIYTVYERHISALEMQNKGLMKRLARLILEFPNRETGGVVGRANIILTTHNCGFI